MESRISLVLQNNPLKPHNQARNSIEYTILKHETNEMKSVPWDPNFIEFPEILVNKKFLETLYQHPQMPKLSDEFKYNLLVFYLYLITSAIIILLSAGALYSQDMLSLKALSFHMIWIFLVLLGAAIVFVMIIKNHYYRLHNRNLLSLLGLAWIIYLILGNQGLLSTILKENNSSNHIHFSIGIVGFVYFFRLALFDSFKHFFVVIALTLVLGIVLSMSLSQAPKIEIINEFAMYALVLVLQLIESQKVWYRCSQLFLRAYLEDMQNNAMAEENQGNNQDLISYTEILVEKCEKVIKEISAIRKTIIYNDMKTRLKSTISVMKQIRKFLGRSAISETVQFADNSSIDFEDKEFISQNFLNVRKNVPERNRDRHGTLKDLIERKLHFSYSSTMLMENVNLLDTLGTEWNINMLTMSTQIGHTVSIIGKHLYHKWSLHELLNVNQDVAYRFFEHIEIVSHI
jgi:hypothetical protein